MKVEIQYCDLFEEVNAALQSSSKISEAQVSCQVLKTKLIKEINLRMSVQNTLKKHKPYSMQVFQEIVGCWDEIER
ncbi:hypothetical protein NL529_29990, partial [Klebsiella pneumoniae]|nr:hypothetical protein [Klebsiella pneumoniae]